MKQCPWFNRCGGCKYDFASADYRDKKLSELHDLPITDAPIWIESGNRRRADFCFAGNQFGFFEKKSKNIVPVRECPNIVPEINKILPIVANLPWCGAGSCLITACDNGIDIAISADVPYFSAAFKSVALAVPAIRITWNNQIIKQTETPVVSFNDVTVPYPTGAFLQPSVIGASHLRQMVADAAAGATRVADLFCGLGNFTFELNADGFDIVGCGVKRDLFKNPLTVGMLNQYDCVIMDPPRAGAMAQCQELIKSNVPRVIYVSCNPQTLKRDMEILTRGGYKLQQLRPVDQFVGSLHWEIFSVFEK